MKFAKFVVKCRHLILIVALALMVPSVIGMAATRINYDMLNYLPDNIDTIEGANILLDDFGTGAFSMIVVEDMEDKDLLGFYLGVMSHAFPEYICHDDKFEPEDMDVLDFKRRNPDNYGEWFFGWKPKDL